MNYYKISFLILFMVSVFCISCYGSDDEEREQGFENDEREYDEQGDASEPQEKEQGDASELQEEEPEPLNIELNEEAQKCVDDIRRYFPKAKMRENVKYAMERYLKNMGLNLNARRYYVLMTRNLYRGRIPLLAVFCKEKAEEALPDLTAQATSTEATSTSEASPSKKQKVSKELHELRVGYSKDCKRLIELTIGGVIVHILHNAINEITTQMISQINNPLVTAYWNLVINHFGFRMGEGQMQHPAEFCVHIQTNRRRRLF